MVKKIAKIVGVLLVLIIVILGVLMYLSQTPLSKEAAVTQINTSLEKNSKPSDHFSGVQARVYSPQLDIDFLFANGTSLRAGTLSAEQPFHVASVGKLFTATIIYQLAEEGKIALDDPIVKTIDPSLLGPLYVFEGVDYIGDVTYRQLLSHTSGVADYFDGPVISGQTMSTLLKTQSDKTWLPQELLDFSIERQVSVYAPGKGYHYSDTGYILLGFLIETLENKSFEAVLEDRIFKPLEMRDSYMAMRSTPLSGQMPPIADLWLETQEYGDKKALSVDWSGGGVISTLDDLLKFSRALHSGGLISDASLLTMFSDTNAFEQGIYTGDGGMTVRFKEFFPLLDLPVIRGHIGILGTHLFYDPTTDTHIVLNFGSTNEMVPSFTTLIEILSTLKRIEVKH